MIASVLENKYKNVRWIIAARHLRNLAYNWKYSLCVKGTEFRVQLS